MKNPILDLINDMRYRQFAERRDSCPDIRDVSWRFIYGDDFGWLESRYQAERALKKAAA